MHAHAQDQACADNSIAIAHERLSRPKPSGGLVATRRWGRARAEQGCGASGVGWRPAGLRKGQLDAGPQTMAARDACKGLHTLSQAFVEAAQGPHVHCVE